MWDILERYGGMPYGLTREQYDSIPKKYERVVKREIYRLLAGNGWSGSELKTRAAQAQTNVWYRFYLGLHDRHYEFIRYDGLANLLKRIARAECSDGERGLLDSSGLPMTREERRRLRAEEKRILQARIRQMRDVQKMTFSAIAEELTRERFNDTGEWRRPIGRKKVSRLYHGD